MGVAIHANNENLFSTLECKDVKTIIVSPQKMEEIRNSDLSPLVSETFWVRMAP